MKNNIKTALFVLVVMGISLWPAFMLVDKRVPYEYDMSDSYIRPNPAEANAMISSDWGLSAPVKRICPATVQRQFRNLETNKVTVLDTTEASRAVQIGDKRVVRSFRLPPLPHGDFGYSVRVCFQCNIMQKLIAPNCVMTPEIYFSIK